MKKDYFITFATTQVILVVNLLLFKIVALFFGQEGFEIYNIARRTISVLSPLLMMGIGVSIVRHVAIIKDSDYLGKDKLLLTSIIPTTILFIILVLIAILIPNYFSSLFFGNNSLHVLALALIVFVYGLSLCGFIQSYFRGKMQFVYTNIMNFIIGAVIPVLSIIIFSDSIEEMYFGAGITMIILSFIIFFKIIKKNKYISLFDIEALKIHLTYGLPRTLGDIGFYLIMFLPTWWTSYTYGLEYGGQVAFATTILNLCASVITPISSIILPKASQMFKDNMQIELKKIIIKLILLVSIVSIIWTIVIFFWSDFFINFLLGPEYLGYTDMIRIISFGIFPYSLYMGLRSIIDAKTSIPINTILTSISLIFMIAWNCFSLQLYNDGIYIIFGLLLSLYILSILSVVIIFMSIRKY